MNAHALSEPNRIRVLVVDDHPAVAEGLTILLEAEGITVCAEAATRADALSSADEERPVLALVDLSLANGDSLNLIRDLQERAVPSLVYSMHGDAWHVDSAFAGGARGYVTKREVHGVLIQGISAVAAGRHFISPRAALALAEQLATNSSGPAES